MTKRVSSYKNREGLCEIVAMEFTGTNLHQEEALFNKRLDRLANGRFRHFGKNDEIWFGEVGPTRRKMLRQLLR